MRNRKLRNRIKHDAYAHACPKHAYVAFALDRRLHSQEVREFEGEMGGTQSLLPGGNHQNSSG